MKYIIDIPEDAKYGILTCKVDRGMGYYTKDIDLTEAEQLTAVYINEHFGSLQQDAYYQGYKDGRNVTETQAHDDAYQRGLEDAWDAAWLIFNMSDEDAMEAGLDTAFNLSVSEAIAKLKAYEEKQKTDNCIEIGDEVEWDGDKYIVTYRNMDTNIGVIQDYDLLAYDGSVVDHVKKCVFTKTGRHFDISKILEEMKK